MNVLKNFVRKYSSPVSMNLKEFRIPLESNLDYNYICNPDNFNEISQNIVNRKGVGNIELVQKLYKDLLESTHESSYEIIKRELHKEASRIPNKTHPIVSTYKNEPKQINLIGTKKPSTSELYEFHTIGKKLNLLRTEQLGNLAGSRSYYFLGELAELETALIKYTLKSLLKQKFCLLSVPDLLDRNIIECCGLNTRGERTQVYSLDETKHGPNICLSGTSEMAIAGYFANKIIPSEQLPLRVAAVSRCYRAETSSIAEEKGIYRVHQFTKVEMFALTKPAESDEMLEEFRKYEENHFADLGLHLRTLDMPPHELGAPAYRKYDVEAWLPARNMYGEVSSCSNCTDFQSRRLNIRYIDSKTDSNGTDFVHTLNGTACAVPRMLIALLETNQRENGTIDIPEILQPYMNGKKSISKQKHIPELKLLKHKK